MIDGSAWSLRNIYLYAVCLITLIIVIFAAANVVKSVAEMLYPEPQQMVTMAKPVDGDVELDIAAEQARIEQQNDAQQQWAYRRAVISVVQSGMLVLLAAPLYVYHWRKIERERAVS